MSLNRFLERFRREDASAIAEARKAVARTEEIRQHVERQWADVHRYDRFAVLKIQENHISPKIRAAVASRRGER